MKYLQLQIDNKLINHLKSESLFNQFPKIHFFYFTIPSFLSYQDKDYLVKQGYSFFLSQFDIDVSGQIKEVSRLSGKYSKNTHKKLTWDLFYRYHKWIKICEGVYNETNQSISGAIGKIVDFYSDENQIVYLIEFPKMEDFKKNNLLSENEVIKEVLDYLFLTSDLFMPAKEPENIEIIEKLQTKSLVMNSRLQFELDTRNVDTISNFIHCWEKLLQTKFSQHFPSVTHLSQNRQYRLIDIPYSERRYGVWGTFENNYQIIDIPLIDVINLEGNEILDKLLISYKSEINQLLQEQ